MRSIGPAVTREGKKRRIARYSFYRGIDLIEIYFLAGSRIGGDAAGPQAGHGNVLFSLPSLEFRKDLPDRSFSVVVGNRFPPVVRVQPLLPMQGCAVGKVHKGPVMVPGDGQDAEEAPFPVDDIPLQ